MLRNPLYRYGDEHARVPAHTNVAKEILEHMCKIKDDIAVMSDTGDKLTYGEFAQKTVDIALSLTRLGVGKGDVVSICSTKRLEFLPTVLGIISTGASFSPMDPTYGTHPQLHRLKMTKPKVMFSTLTSYEQFKETFEAAGSIKHTILYGEEEREGTILFKDFLTATAPLEEFRPVEVEGWQDWFCIFYSSGTTGLPKGVPATHLGYLLNAQCLVPDSYKGYKILSTREWYNTYGLSYTLACLRVGCTIVYSLKTEEKDMLEAVYKFQTEVIQAAPSTVMQLIKSSILDQYDLSCVKYIISSSTCMKEEPIKAVKQRLPSLQSVLQMYGMTEGGCICNEIDSPKGSRLGSVGTPNAGFIMKVVDLKTRQPLGANQTGEICIKGPGVMKQYLGNVVPGFKDEEGFLKTGDVGYYDDDGYFYIVNRIKELIKFSDIAIAPAELEDILLQHSSVRDAGVVGEPHPTYGEVAVGFVVLQPGTNTTAEELVQHVDSRVTFRMRLAGGVRFIEKLPHGPGGKLDRQALKTLLIEQTMASN